MCLSDFIEYKHINEFEAVTGYRNWRVEISNPKELFSECQPYKWFEKNQLFEGPHEVKDKNSGIYSYNNNHYNYNYNYYYNYNYNNNYNYNQNDYYKHHQYNDYNDFNSVSQPLPMQPADNL